jgi:hypothetical protein
LSQEIVIVRAKVGQVAARNVDSPRPCTPDNSGALAIAGNMGSRTEFKELWRDALVYISATPGSLTVFRKLEKLGTW